MLLETSAFRGKRMNLKRSKEYEPCLFSVWLVTCPKLFFPLGQDLPISRQKHLEEVCLWRTDISNLSNDFKWYQKCEYDGVIQIKLNVGQICFFVSFLLLFVLLFAPIQSVRMFSIVLLSMLMAYLSEHPHF